MAQLPLSLPAVVCSFRGSVSQGLVLDLGETVHILEKCEGKNQHEDQDQDKDQGWGQDLDQGQKQHSDQNQK